MGLITLAAQLVSILSKFFGPFPQKRSEAFPPHTYPINSIFSLVACIYNVHVFDEAYFHFANVTILTEKRVSSLFFW